MKFTYILLIIVGLSTSLLSCTKENDPNAQDYYKNKTINLNISSTDVENSDHFTFSIAAMGVDLSPTKTVKVQVNGGEETLSANIDQTTFLDGNSVNIATTSPAWKMVVKYNLVNNANPTTVTLTPTFDGNAADPIVFELKGGEAKVGTIEVKHY